MRIPWLLSCLFVMPAQAGIQRFLGMVGKALDASRSLPRHVPSRGWHDKGSVGVADHMAYYWYQSSLHFLLFPLLPLSWLFCFCVTVRSYLYRRGWKKTQRFSAPVIVVGNITIGGTGKTPLVIWLVEFLKSQGFSPGIVSRGVGGKKHSQPYWVSKQDMPVLVGDEALLLAEHTQCPVVICINRALAVKTLLANSHCDIVVSDDGLQHYRMGRDVEIALLDGARGLGNRCLLPAGPLRESSTRLQTVDFVVVRGEEGKSEFTMDFEPQEWRRVVEKTLDPAVKPRDDSASARDDRKEIHAVAGIGHPEQFFSMLEKQGYVVRTHVFPDHYVYRAEDFHFGDDLPIVMTEKDAVKCRGFADERFWYVPVTVTVSGGLGEKVVERVRGILSCQRRLASSVF